MISPKIFENSGFTHPLRNLLIDYVFLTPACNVDIFDFREKNNLSINEFPDGAFEQILNDEGYEYIHEVK